MDVEQQRRKSDGKWGGAPLSCLTALKRQRRTIERDE